MEKQTLEEIANTLNQAVSLIGPQRNSQVEPPLYTFLRRYSPMFCADTVLVPQGEAPSVLLAQRGNKAVAAGQWWIFGGRIDKNLDYCNLIKGKIKSEIGLEVDVSYNDIIGMGKTYFLPDPNEEMIRDYDVSTPNLCFAKQIPLTENVQQKICAADGHSNWKIFNVLDSTWHPYIVHAVANAWDLYYGQEWVKEIDDSTKKILSEREHFIPLRYKDIFNLT